MKKIIVLLTAAFFLVSFNVEKKVVIYSIGDSTMCNYNEQYLSSFGGAGYPIRGWMQMMPQFFNDKVEIHNMARSGRSSKSFRTEGFWKKTIDSVKAGDYVFIMFGPNDEKADTARHTDPQTTYKQNLINYIDETNAKGAHPVLFTSLPRRRFDKTGRLLPDSFEGYVTAAKEVAKEKNIPLVDLNKDFRDVIQKCGPEDSKKYYLNVAPGKFTKLPKGKNDQTHFCEEGATEIAKIAADEFRKMNLPFAKFLK